VAGRNPGEAVAAFTQPIANALGCFARGRLSADVQHPRDGYGVLTFNDEESFPLDAHSNVTLSMTMHYEIREDDTGRGPWKVSTTGWVYALRAKTGDTVEYHWHPVSDSHSTEPHVHVNDAKAHLPTGRILIEEILDLGIEMGAVCGNLAKWTDLRMLNRQNFELGATWGTKRTPPTAAPRRKH
jgi:hypothetical protein